jgi:hypothetical protein
VGAARGWCGRGCRRCALLGSVCSGQGAVREEGNRNEKGEEKENEGKEKKNMEIFSNLKISEK